MVYLVTFAKLLFANCSRRVYDILFAPLFLNEIQIITTNNAFSYFNSFSNIPLINARTHDKLNERYVVAQLTYKKENLEKNQFVHYSQKIFCFTGIFFKC